MSAIRIDKECILYLVQAAQSNQVGTKNLQHFYYNYKGLKKIGYDHGFSRIATLLDIENAKSIFSRYSDFSRLSDFSSPKWSVFDPLQVIKSIDFFCYQSCEHEGFYDSEAYSFLKSLKNKAIDSLPGYDDKVWGIPPKGGKS